MSRFQTGISQRPVFSGGYYGQQQPQYAIDPGLAFQQAARYSPLGASAMSGSALFAMNASDPRQAMWRADAEELQARERDRQAEIERQLREQQLRERDAQLAEQGRLSEYERQRRAVERDAALARQASREQAVIQSNLQVMNEAGRGLQARDDRAYKQRHPYLPGQSPGEQQDARQGDLRFQNDQLAAQKMLDQQIRGEDQLTTMRRQKEAEGWAYTPEQQEMNKRLDEQVGVAHQKLLSGEITRTQYGKYLEMIQRAKSETFPTQPPNPEQVNAQFMLGNRAAVAGSSSSSSRGGVGLGELSKFNQDRYSSWLNSAERDFTALEQDYSGKGEAPNWEKHLRARMKTLPGPLRAIAESEYFSNGNQVVDPNGNQGNAQPSELGGVNRPNAGGGGESVPTELSNGDNSIQGFRKRDFDASRGSTPEMQERRMSSIQGSFQNFVNGTHPYLESAVRKWGQESVEPIRQRVIELSVAYAKSKDDETWRELTSTLMGLAKMGQGPAKTLSEPQLTEGEMQSLPRRQSFQLNETERPGVDPRIGEQRRRADIELNQGAGATGFGPSEDEIMAVMRDGQMSYEEASQYLAEQYAKTRRQLVR